MKIYVLNYNYEIMTEVIKYKFKMTKISKKLIKISQYKDFNDEQSTSTIPRDDTMYFSPIPTIFPRPIEKPIEILPNGKFRVTLKKDSENLKFFKTNLKEGCKCKSCWIQRKFELVTVF